MSRGPTDMVTPDPDRPRVLAVSGVDPCGGAGLVADVRAIEWAGGFALGVPTCTTVQNRYGFRCATPTPRADFEAMLDAAFEDGPVDAVKTGLFVTIETLDAFLDHFARLAPRPVLVVDPVLSATAGGGDGVLESCQRTYPKLAALGAVLTPNLPELQQLAGGEPRRLLLRGAAAVVVKGGHGSGDEVVDVLHRTLGEPPLEFRRDRIRRHGGVHGTGCVFAALLATRLAAGLLLEEATRHAGDDLARWIAATPSGDRPTPLAGR